MNLKIKVLLSILAAFMICFQLIAQGTPLSPPRMKEWRDLVYIRGYAMTQDKGVLPIWFFPVDWTPIDSIKKGLLKGIQVRRSDSDIERICKNGIQCKYVCIWECQLVLTAADARCLMEDTTWIERRSQVLIFDQGAIKSEPRLVILTTCVYSLFVNYSLFPIKYGSNRIRNKRLKHALESD